MLRPFGHPDTAKAMRETQLRQALERVRITAIIVNDRDPMPEDLAMQFIAITKELGQLA